MMALAAWLDFRQLLWCHVPNESRSAVYHRVNLARQGVKRGVPDVLIFTPPFYSHPQRAPHMGVPVGAALELKAGKGRATAAQRDWLDALAKVGWLVSVQTGADEAIRWLRSLGY